MNIGGIIGLSLLAVLPGTAFCAVLPRVIEFSEETPRPLMLLDGREHYSARGISFADEVYLLSDKRFIHAGLDRWGITTIWERDHRFAVLFDEGASQVNFDWVSLWSSDFSATAFWRDEDGYHKLGCYEIQDLLPRLNYGQGSLNGSSDHPIDRIVFDNSEGFIGVGRLEYQPASTAVPLPSSLWAGIALLVSITLAKAPRGRGVMSTLIGGVLRCRSGGSPTG